MLVPGAIGIGLCNATLSSLVSKSAGSHEQGRVQGAAGGLESLGRTIGPVWGNGSLQKFGEGTAYGSATIVRRRTHHGLPSAPEVARDHRAAVTPFDLAQGVGSIREGRADPVPCP